MGYRHETNKQKSCQWLNIKTGVKLLVTTAEKTTFFFFLRKQPF